MKWSPRFRLNVARGFHERGVWNCGVDVWRPTASKPWNIDLGNAAHDRRIVRHVLQADGRRAVDAEVRRRRVVIAARVAEADVADQVRRGDPREPERQPLRAVVVRAEGVIERPFAQAEQGRGAERQRIDEAVAAEERELAADLMIEADVELVLPGIGDRRGRIDRRARHVRIGNQRDDGRADRIPAIARDHPLTLGVPAELGTPGRKRVDHRRAEQPQFLGRRRYLPHARHAFEVAQAFVISEPERSVLDQRSADRGAELVALPLRLRGAERVREEIVRVQRIVAEELVDAAANRIGAGFDDGVDDRSRAAAELGRVSVRLNLEFLQRLDRRLHELHVLAAERVRVGDVIDAVEQEDIVERAVAVHVEHALEVHARQPRGAREHAGREQRQLVVVAAIERQLDDLLLIDDRSARRRDGVEQRRGADDLDRFGELTRLQRDVDPRHLRDLQSYPRPHRLLESRHLHGHRVVTGTKAGNHVGALAIRGGSGDDAGLHVRHRHGGVRHDGAAAVPDDAGDGRRFLLGRGSGRPGAKQSD